MKLITCRYNGAEHTAVVTHGDTQAVMTEDLGYHFRDMNDLIRSTDRSELRRMGSALRRGSGKMIPLNRVELTAPPFPPSCQDVIFAWP